MIRRNRKKRMHGFVLPAPFAGVVVLGAILALTYVWLGSRCTSLGRDIKALEQEKARLKRDILSEESRWTRMKSPVNIEMILARNNIVMTWPRPGQVVRLYEPVANPEVRSRKPGAALTYIKRDKAVVHD